MSELQFSEKTKFSVICNVLEQIYKQNNLDKKVEIMKQFIASFREQNKNRNNDSFYPILRLFLPHMERERGPYGIKEHTLAKIYIRILGLAKDGKDALKLTNYRAPKSSAKGVSDFAEMAYWVLRSRFGNEGKLTIFDVNQHLDNIAMKHASHDPRGVDDELQAMLLKMSPEEQKWLIRILLKDLSIGLSHNRILYLYHPDSVDYYDVTNDLQKLCSLLKDPSVRLHEIEISIFQPFKPMLSKRCDVQYVDKEINSADHYYAEIKFDGERFQIHCSDGEYKYFSRNGYDYTDTYGCNALNGVLTPKIAKCLSSNVKSCILDGEMMCWHKKRKCFTTKGMDIDVKYIKDADVNQACFCVFDILYLNGNVLTNKPFVERAKIMEDHITSEEGVIVISNKTKVTNGDEILNLLNEAIANCEEGLVVKEPCSVYKPNSRKAGWYKIKPEYTEGLMVELDLLVIGGYYGEGRRRGIVSQFLLGLADSKKDQDGKPYIFYSMARVGSGYSDDELSELDRKMQGNWKRVKPNILPPGIEWTKEKPDVWIEPKSSFILQVKATEVVPSDAFKVGYTLRFPRVQKVRYDKPWTDCLTLDEFNGLRETYGGKLCGNYATKLNALEEKKQTKRPKKVFTVEDQFKSKKFKNIELISNIFQEKEICVLTGHEQLSKEDLEMKIVQFGGLIVQHPGSDTYCVVSSNQNYIRTKNVIKLNKYDVIKSSWILECAENNKLVDWSPEHFLSMSPETAERISERYDRYGDSYTETVDIECLKKLLNTTDEEVDISIEEMQKLDEELFKNGNPYAFFRGCYAYFFTASEILNYQEKIDITICKEIFKFYGGCEQNTIDEKTTHIIRHSIDTSSPCKSFRKKNIVNEKWILDSQKSKTRLKELLYK